MSNLSKISYKIYRFFRKGFLLIGLSFLLLVIFTTLITVLNSKDRILIDANEISGKNTVLVLGTSKYAQSGKENHFYSNRITAAKKLYDSNKVSKFILSGHKDRYYNEPQQMKEDLILMGVPEKLIIKDERGDRTINSILNLKEIFNLKDEIIIVSQNFHLQRALLIAAIYKVDAIGFSANSPSLEDSFKTYLREILARIRLLLDIISY